MNSKIYDTFIKLVRQGIGHETQPLSTDVDWSVVKTLADTHGLTAVVLDGIDKCSKGTTEALSVAMKLEWIGEVLQNYEQRYKLYENAISSLAGFYNHYGYKMMVLKGYACSMDWPKPEHRPCGDIDIWQFGKQKEADKALVKDKGIKIDNSHQHHTVFYWLDFMVENHYDFINVYHHKSSAEVEKILKRLGEDDSHFVEVYGEKVFLPSANLHALFLLRHAMSEFASSCINVRLVLDWAFFVEKQGKDVDWDWLLGVLDEFHMREFLNCINGICVDDLGFSATIFPYVQYLPVMKERVLNDIISPKYTAGEPKSLFPRIIYKYRRWKANGWKHKLCYKESMWSAFWSGVWNHLLKPASI